MAIKTNSLTIEETGCTLTNSYSKVNHFQVTKNPTLDTIDVSVSVAHYANSSSRAANKMPVQNKDYYIQNCSDITGSLASGSISYVYDKIKLQAPFSGSTISDV